jgi:Immunity protein 26
MKPYELTNDQRKYVGLTPVADDWDRQPLNDTVVVYFDKEKLVKVLNYGWGYIEYDTDIDTRGRKFLLPKTAKGKEHKLTIARLLKIKGIGIQFSASFEGGGIHVYDNKRNLFFIKSFIEDRQILNFDNIEAWIKKYIKESPANYFDWLNEELSKSRQHNKAREGDIIAYPIGRQEFGFAKVLLNGISSSLPWVDTKIFDLNLFGKPLMVLPYAFIAENTVIDLDILLKQPVLPHVFIFDSDVYYGAFPIIGNRPVTQSDFNFAFPLKKSKYLNIPYSKTDIQSYFN